MYSIVLFSKFLLTRLLRGVTATNTDARSFIVISTHTPLTRRDVPGGQAVPGAWRFLLTRLLRGVTSGSAFLYQASLDFYSHASYEAWHRNGCPNCRMFLFLLTRLLRGVTLPFYSQQGFLSISTHTPLTRRDVGRRSVAIQGEISTHTPLTRRDLALLLTTLVFLQISTHTPLTRRDVCNVWQPWWFYTISTHTPLTRRDISF